MKDWTGNSNSVFKTLGSSQHSDHNRQPYDYYATEPRAAQLLLDVDQFHHDIWECACGEKHLANVLTQAGYNVRCSDIVNNGNFDGLRNSGGSAVAYAWYVWEKGYNGNTIIKWIN